MIWGSNSGWRGLGDWHAWHGRLNWAQSPISGDAGLAFALWAERSAGIDRIHPGVRPEINRPSTIDITVCLKPPNEVEIEAIYDG
jgi:hypothetical protein